MRRVLVHIDRLVLKGFAHADRHALAEGLREELARQLTEPGLAVRLASRSRSDRVDAGHVGIGPAGSLRPVGAQIALGIAKGITS
jgi:hypothetical protein